MLRSALTALLCTAPLLWGAPKSSSAKQLTPTLDLLPDGSTLRDVRIPRYDDEKRPAALLRASLMEVISKSYVRADNVTLLVFNPDGSEQLQVLMNSADYHVTSGVLDALKHITITSGRFHAEGQGGIFQLDSRRGFLHGPVSTSFLPAPPETTMHAPATLRPLTALLVSTATLALAAPEPFTEAELKVIDAQMVSESAPLLEEIAPTRELITRTDQLSQAATIGLKSFAQEIKRPVLLTALTPDKAPKPKPETPKPDPKGLQVTCEGGMYFDAEKGHLVYLKNVFIKEPRFTMRAGTELKIFLEKKPALPAAKPKPTDKPATEDKPASFGGPSNFGDVKNIIATGGVEVLKRAVKKEAKPDPAAKPADKRVLNDKPIRATAATATYDNKSGDIVLRGDFPLIQQGSQYIRAQEAGLYIRIYANGDLYFQPGKWETFVDRAEAEKNP